MLISIQDTGWFFIFYLQKKKKKNSSRSIKIEKHGECSYNETMNFWVINCVILFSGFISRIAKPHHNTNHFYLLSPTNSCFLLPPILSFPLPWTVFLQHGSAPMIQNFACLFRVALKLGKYDPPTPFLTCLKQRCTRSCRCINTWPFICNAISTASSNCSKILQPLWNLRK